MKVKLHIGIGEENSMCIDIVAETKGEEAILHLLSENKTVDIIDRRDCHWSYAMTRELRLTPHKEKI